MSNLPVHPSHLRWTITLSKKTSPNPIGGCCRPCLPQNPSFVWSSYHSLLSLVWLFKMHFSHWTESSGRVGTPWNCSSLHPQCPAQVLTQSMHYSINFFEQIHWIIENAREFQKNTYFCFFDYTKSLWLDYNELWEILKEMGILDYLTCLLRNLCSGQKATVRTGHGPTD